jgi:hypothetical protein
MPHSFFILYRLFLRVDNVLFRMYDIRIYHAFESGEVVREIVGIEADYETIKGVRLSVFWSHRSLSYELPAPLSPPSVFSVVSGLRLSPSSPCYVAGRRPETD